MEEEVSLSMFLFTRPDYDPVTKYLSAWSKVLIDEVRAKAIEVIDLVGAKANKKEFEGRLKKKRPSLIVLNGHGNDDCVTGQDEEPLVQTGDNAHVLSGSVAYAVSCNSATRLGKEVGAHVDTAYIGYEKKFSFIHTRGFFKRPEEDPAPRPFMEFSNQVVRGLIKGHTAEESVRRAMDVGEGHLRKLESSLSDPNVQMAAAFLWRDISCLIVHGEGDKKVI